jgi:hypothetical protein
MVRHHILIGLGFKKQNFRNRALHYMLNKNHGSGFYVNHGAVPSHQMTIMPVAPSHLLPRLSRQPLKFNY